MSGITQVLLCTTSPTSSLRSMPPPLVGEALAFRDVFQQTQISFIGDDTSLPRAPLVGEALAFRDVFRQTQISFTENETSLPRAPLPGELAPQASERLDKGRL